MVRFVLAISGYVVGIPLELLVIAAMLHGSYRRFPAVFAYVTAEFLTTCIEMPLALSSYYTRDAQTTARFAFWYWTDEIVLQFLVFAVVLSLIWEATSVARSQRALRTGLLTGVPLFVGISFLVHFSPQTVMGHWMTPWARDLNFGSAILDMLLWAMLIANSKRQKDSCLMMLSGGLGIMFTGAAIAESLRTLATKEHPLVIIPAGVLMILTNLAFLYIWWQAVRVPRAVPPRPLVPSVKLQ